MGILCLPLIFLRSPPFFSPFVCLFVLSLYFSLSVCVSVRSRARLLGSYPGNSPAQLRLIYSSTPQTAAVFKPWLFTPISARLFSLPCGVNIKARLTTPISHRFLPHPAPFSLPVSHLDHCFPFGPTLLQTLSWSPAPSFG